MPEPQAHIPTGAPPDSPHAIQLRRGFPRLKFDDPPLEREFRQAHRAESLPQIRRNLWLAIVFVVGISLLTHMVLESEVNRLLDLIRLAVFGPILAIGMGVVYSKLYDRYYTPACQVGAPIFGVGVVIVAVLAASHSVNLISTVVLATIYIYFLLGMTFYGAVSAALVVLASYLLAASIAELPPAVVLTDSGTLIFANILGAMVCYSLERANRRNFLEERLLIEMASRDGLTGIHNRRTFDDHIERIWPQAIRDKAPLALMLVDIDHFKAYNDYYGHQAGDECLRQVATCLTSCARRPLDVAARYGGEEFAIVLYDVRREHVEDAAHRVQSAMQALAIPHEASPAERRQLTVSIGAACIEPVMGRSRFGFIQLADEALYAAKERGRDCVVIMDKEYAKLSTGSFRKSAAAAGAR